MIEKKIPKINLQLFAGEGEVTEEVEKNTPELTVEEQIAQAKAEAKAEIEKEIERKKKEDDVKKENEELKEKVKKAKSNITKSEEKKEDVTNTEDKITISNLRNTITEMTEVIDTLQAKIDSLLDEQKLVTVKNAIAERIDKEPYLKDTVNNFLKKGLIKSIEDYDNIMDSELKNALKTKWELLERNKRAGADPLSVYDNKTNKVDKQADKKAVSDDKKASILKKLGIVAKK